MAQSSTASAKTSATKKAVATTSLSSSNNTFYRLTNCMPATLHDFIARTPIIDVHEHHIPDILLNRDVNLLQIFQQSYAGWTQARPYPLPSETRAEDPMLGAVPPATWEALAPYLENSASNSFVRNLVSALTDLYKIPEREITRENW